MPNRPFDRRKDQAPVNWRRGLLRLWVLISGAWIAGWVIFFAIDIVAGQWTNRDLLVIPIVLFGPPFALLLFAIATRWAFRGFESE